MVYLLIDWLRSRLLVTFSSLISKAQSDEECDQNPKVKCAENGQKSLTKQSVSEGAFSGAFQASLFDRRDISGFWVSQMLFYSLHSHDAKKEREGEREGEGTLVSLSDKRSAGAK